jgi:hypothetical protein
MGAIAGASRVGVARVKTLSKKAVRRSAPARRRGREAFRRIPLPEPVRRQMFRVVPWRPWTQTVPLDKLLTGLQGERTAAEFVARTGQLTWTSTPVTEGPHAKLLALGRDRGVELTDEEILATPYARLAGQLIELDGHFFSATDDAGIVAAARSFIARGLGDSAAGSRPPAYASREGTPIYVAPIKASDCFQVLDGHHRLAVAAARGETTARVKAKWVPVQTPLQSLLDQMSWIGGQRELYQPVSAPELEKSWVTVRACTDRLDKMKAFLGERDLLPPSSQTYLDIASCYGWFVDQMGRLGFEANGMERDPLGPQLGQAIYGLDPSRISVGDCVELLEQDSQRWDVVSCFSLLHHFVLGRGSVSAEKLIASIDSVVGKVLFIDTGQVHEEWFQRSLPGWDTARVRSFLEQNTSFTTIVDLGPDRDAVAPYAKNYGRHLFACTRD